MSDESEDDVSIASGDEWEENSNCSSIDEDLFTDFRFRDCNGQVVDSEGEVSDDQAESDSEEGDEDEREDVPCTSSQFWQDVEEREACSDRPQIEVGPNYGKLYAIDGAHRLVGGRRVKGEKRGGMVVAKSRYGPAKLAEEHNNEFILDGNESLLPIRIVTEDFTWGRKNQMKDNEEEFAVFESKKPQLTKWDATESSVAMFLSFIQRPLKVFIDNTNKKGTQMMNATAQLPKNRRFRWQNLTEIDALAYIVAMFRVDMLKKRRLRDYWSQSSAKRDPLICELSAIAGMSHRKYVRIMHACRLYDEDEARLSGASDKTSPTYDTQCRVRPFIDATNLSLQEHRIPGEALSLDESMLRFAGRFADVQFMPKKPIKRGIKHFYLCDPDGYTYRMLMHTSQTLPWSAEMGYIFSVVWALMDGNTHPSLISYLDSWRTVVTDRYYGSVSTAIALLDRWTYFISTMKSNMQHLPSMVEVNPDGSKRNLLAASRFPRGSCRFWFDTSGRLMFLVWSDSQPVRILSSYPKLTTQMGSCKRRKKGQSAKGEYARPEIIAMFSKLMGGVDLCDQLLDAGTRHQKTFLWFTNLFHRVLNLFVTNIYAIKSSAGMKTRTLELKEAICEGLFDIIKSHSKPMVTRPPHTLSTDELERRKKEAKGYQHGFEFLKNVQRRVCVECHQSNAQIRCKDCENVIVHTYCWQTHHNK